MSATSSFAQPDLHIKICCFSIFYVYICPSVKVTWNYSYLVILLDKLFYCCFPFFFPCIFTYVKIHQTNTNITIFKWLKLHITVTKWDEINCPDYTTLCWQMHILVTLWNWPNKFCFKDKSFYKKLKAITTSNKSCVTAKSYLSRLSSNVFHRWQFCIFNSCLRLLDFRAALKAVLVLLCPTEKYICKLNYYSSFLSSMFCFLIPLFSVYPQSSPCFDWCFTQYEHYKCLEVKTKFIAQEKIFSIIKECQSDVSPLTWMSGRPCNLFDEFLWGVKVRKPSEIESNYSLMLHIMCWDPCLAVAVAKLWPIIPCYL